MGLHTNEKCLCLLLRKLTFLPPNNTITKKCKSARQHWYMPSSPVINVKCFVIICNIWIESQCIVFMPSNVHYSTVYQKTSQAIWLQSSTSAAYNNNVLELHACIFCPLILCVLLVSGQQRNLLILHSDILRPSIVCFTRYLLYAVQADSKVLSMQHVSA